MAKALLTLSRLAARSEPSTGTRITEARESVAYWARRADDLSSRRRAERREARTRASSARAQLIGAHVERWGLPAVDRRLTPLLDTGGRSAGAHARSLALSSLRGTALGRRLLIAATGLSAAAAVAGAAVVALAIHFL